MTAAAWGFYGIVAAGAVALWCLMPRRGDAGAAGRGRRAVGTLIATAAAAGLIVWLLSQRQVQALMPMSQPVVGPFFYLFALIALATAVRTIVHPRPVYSALYFVMTVLAIAGVVLLANAEFLAIALILIYAGAIIVTYVFVIMLAQQARGEDLAGSASYDLRSRPPVLPLLLGFLLLASLGGPLSDESNWPATGPAASVAQAPPAGGAAAMGSELFDQHLLAIELAGVLLLAAIVGAVAVARKRVGPADRIAVAPSNEEGNADA